MHLLKSASPSFESDKMHLVKIVHSVTYWRCRFVKNEHVNLFTFKFMVLSNMAEYSKAKVKFVTHIVLINAASMAVVFFHYGSAIVRFRVNG